MAASDFWYYGQRAYFDSSVFNPEFQENSIQNTQNGSLITLVFNATRGIVKVLEFTPS